jgi:hypothetical protein
MAKAAEVEAEREAAAQAKAQEIIDEKLREDQEAAAERDAINKRAMDILAERVAAANT